jgi:hypothetical protein
MNFMGRINNLAQWGFSVLAMVAAVSRNAGAPYGDGVEIICVCLLLFGFLAWAALGYIHAWRLAIGDMKARWHARRQA